jgi:putative DNA primase/helicase
MKIGRAIYDAGATRNAVVEALAERDRALGWHKYSGNRDGGHKEYERIYKKLDAEGRNNVTPLRLSGGSAGAIDVIDVNPNRLPASATFPVHAMPKHCRDLIREASEAIGCAPEMIALPMLAVLSAAIGNSRRLQVKGGWEEGACIYAAVIAEPGEKKTPAQVVATEPARRIQTSLKRAYQEQLEVYEGELRQHEVAKAKAKKEGEAAEAPPKKPTFRRTVVGDITTEALAVILEENPRGVLMNRDELAGWVRGMDQYKAGGKGSDRQFWLSVHTNQDTHIDRKSQEPIHLTKPFSSVFGSIQPDVLPEIPSNREDGMLERFLYAYPEPVLSGWSDKEISAKAKSSYDYLYSKLWSLELGQDNYGGPEPQIVEFSSEAKACFISAYNEHYQERRSPGFPRGLKGVWPKLEGYLARLVLILGTCRSETQNKPARIEPEDVLRSQRLVRYFKNQAHRTYAKLYGENPDDVLAEDVVRFLVEREGVFEGSAGELHEQLKSEHKPKAVQWFSKKLEQLAERSPVLSFERDQVSDETSEGRATSKRVIRLFLENYVNCVNGWKTGG